MADTFLIDTRTLESVRFEDWAEVAVASPEILRIPPDEVSGLSPKRDRSELLIRVLTAQWMLVRDMRQRGLIVCDAADPWASAFRSVKAVLASLDPGEGDLIRLNNHLYGRAIVASRDDWAGLTAGDHGRFIRRAIRTHVPNDRLSAGRAGSVIVNRQCNAFRHEEQQQELERRKQLAQMGAAPRPLAADPRDRPTGRLVPAGTNSFHSPVSLDAPVLGEGLRMVEQKMAEPPWLMVVVDTPGCPAVHARLFENRAPSGHISTTAHVALAEDLDEHRMHVAWAYAFLITPVPSMWGQFADTVLNRWEQSPGHALLLLENRCLLKPAGKPAREVAIVHSLGEAETLYSRELYHPWSVETVGGFGFGRWIMHQRHPGFFKPLGWPGSWDADSVRNHPATSPVGGRRLRI